MGRDLTFENDERVIGRWEFVATVAKKEDFAPGKVYHNETIFNELYFLPNGEPYWGFSWTKGFVRLIFNGEIRLPYELDEVGGQLFMFVENPSYGGCWVLKQTDQKHHTAVSIAQQDHVDLPFVDDPPVLGEWVSIDYVQEIEDFNPEQQSTPSCDLGVKAVAFFPGGDFEWTWQSTYKHRWTKGVCLITWRQEGEISHKMAPAYEIRRMNDMEYLFFEHKSGDYIWGRMKPGYFVLRRAEPNNKQDNG